MLRGLFDTLDEASYVESKDALLQLLQTRVWPLLGITSQIHSTIYAWIHFRQFAVTGMLTWPWLHDELQFVTSVDSLQGGLHCVQLSSDP